MLDFVLKFLALELHLLAPPGTCAIRLCDEIDLIFSAQDISAWGAVGGYSPGATVPVEEVMHATLTILVAPGIDRSRAATIPEVVHSKDAL